MSSQDGSMSQNEEKKMPGLAEQGRNLVDLLRDVGEDVLAGEGVFVDTFEQQRRYDICQACPSFERMRKRCKECGCWLPHKIKDPFAYCPIHKWDSDDRQWKKEHYDIIEKELRKKYPELDVWKGNN